ncbi:hypothetical protein [Methylosarcina fibrata]|uniref:hypothetical protein n=1 Tax=Methylosarcina fibrata TaxID=105972 RepID=UPI000366CEAB|nr:hypothetical protein [Methylosarcina fibrata]
MTTAKIEAVTVDKKINHLINMIERYSGFLYDYQLKSIHENMPIIFNNSKSVEEQKDAALSIWCALDDSKRIDFCGWAWCEHLLYSILPKPVFSSVLIETHQRGKGGSLLIHFSLNERIQMFELADPQHLMTSTEYERFLALPDEVKIYRGGSGAAPNKLKYGMSWTTDVDLAAWFANRFTSRGKPLVIEGIAKKKNIFGCFDYEDEIITVGGRVSKMKVLDIDIDSAASRHGDKMKAEWEAEMEKLKTAA